MDINYGKGFTYKCAMNGIDPLLLVQRFQQEKRAEEEEGMLAGISDSITGMWDDIGEDGQQIVLRALAGAAGGGAVGGTFGALTSEEGESSMDSALHDGLIGALMGGVSGAGSEAILQQANNLLGGEGNEDVTENVEDVISDLTEGTEDIVSTTGDAVSDVTDVISENLFDN